MARWMTVEVDLDDEMQELIHEARAEGLERADQALRLISDFLAGYITRGDLARDAERLASVRT